MKVLVEKDGPITTVIINRPEVRNAVDPETAKALRDAFRVFEEDGDALAAVLCGAGGCFCGGYDLKSLSAHGLRDPSELEGDGPMGPSRMLLSKPVIMSVIKRLTLVATLMFLMFGLAVVVEEFTHKRIPEHRHTYESSSEPPSRPTSFYHASSGFAYVVAISGVNPQYAGPMLLNQDRQYVGTK